MVRASKRSPVPTKKKKKSVIEIIPRDMWSRLTKGKAPKQHKKGYCKLCHRHVKNLEAHIKVEHRGAKI